MAYVELWRGSSRETVPLDGERITIGKAAGPGITLVDDETASRSHALLEHLPNGAWCIRDLGSRNGTFVNGERIWGDRALRPGDEILVGQSRFVFRSDEVLEDPTATDPSGAAPSLTPREHDVLVALCRPVLGADVFTEPATIKQMAAQLTVSDAAVKQHLARLYDKFGLHDEDDRRRLRLANEAIRRSAVTLADLKDRPAPT